MIVTKTKYVCDWCNREFATAESLTSFSLMFRLNGESSVVMDEASVDLCRDCRFKLTRWKN